MEKNVFIIHGAFGTPNENWFPWLKEELEKKGYTVYVPEFPTPTNQNLYSWREVFYKILPKVNNESIFVGHSLGPAFILDILEYLNTSIKASFLVAPFIGLLDNPEFDLINHSITAKPFNWEMINNNCKSFKIYYSDNDPYVPMIKSEFLGEKLNAKMNLISDGGHINKSSGFVEIPMVLDDILKI